MGTVINQDDGVCRTSYMLMETLIQEIANATRAQEFTCKLFKDFTTGSTIESRYGVASEWVRIHQCSHPANFVERVRQSVVAAIKRHPAPASLTELYRHVSKFDCSVYVLYDDEEYMFYPSLDCPMPHPDKIKKVKYLKEIPESEVPKERRVKLPAFVEEIIVESEIEAAFALLPVSDGQLWAAWDAEDEPKDTTKYRSQKNTYAVIETIPCTMRVYVEDLVKAIKRGELPICRNSEDEKFRVGPGSFSPYKGVSDGFNMRHWEHSYIDHIGVFMRGDLIRGVHISEFFDSVSDNDYQDPALGHLFDGQKLLNNETRPWQ